MKQRVPGRGQASVVSTVVILGLMLPGMTGCGTITSRSQDGFGRAFPATRKTTSWVTDSEINEIGRTAMTIDYVPSLVTDTLLLPVDLIVGED